MAMPLLQSRILSRLFFCAIECIYSEKSVEHSEQSAAALKFPISVNPYPLVVPRPNLGTMQASFPIPHAIVHRTCCFLALDILKPSFFLPHCDLLQVTYFCWASLPPVLSHSNQLYMVQTI